MYFGCLVRSVQGVWGCSPVEQEFLEEDSGDVCFFLSGQSESQWYKISAGQLCEAQYLPPFGLLSKWCFRVRGLGGPWWHADLSKFLFCLAFNVVSFSLIRSR